MSRRGRCSPADLDPALVAEIQVLVGIVIGPDDLLFPLKIEICRAVLSARGLPVDCQRVCGVHQDSSV